MRGAMWKPTVGQKVRFNDHGYYQCTMRSAEEIRQSQNLTVTSVKDINAGSGWKPIWVIEVDQPLIDRFLLDATMVEPIPEEKS